MLRKLRTAREMRLADWRLFLRAWVLMLLIDLGLHLLPFRRVWNLTTITQKRVPKTEPHQEQQIINQSSKMVNLARRYHLYPMTCLRRALALHRILLQQGVLTELRFGAQKENEELVAHAWLEYQGSPIGEPEKVSQRYLPLSHNS